MSFVEEIMKEGEEKGKFSAIRKQLNKKFSKPIPDDIDAKLDSADEEKIETIIEMIFEIESYDDVREILD